MYVDIPNKTKEQQEEMVRLEKAYKDEADTYVAPKYPEADYPEYYDDDHKLIYDDILGKINSPLVVEYDYWLRQNTLSIYTYICSNQKTLTVRNGNRGDTTYTIKPTLASNANSSNDYLESTDDILPGQTHEFDVIQGTLNSVKFSSVRMRYR